ncbi:hypothetical protein HBA93_21985 [Ochrobactrum sp. SFR4]|nr:hypothetical protein [Ochrobactrum sp. SFR4]
MSFRIVVDGIDIAQMKIAALADFDRRISGRARRIGCQSNPASYPFRKDSA